MEFLLELCSVSILILQSNQTDEGTCDQGEAECDCKKTIPRVVESAITELNDRRAVFDGLLFH